MYLKRLVILICSICSLHHNALSARPSCTKLCPQPSAVAYQQLPDTADLMISFYAYDSYGQFSSHPFIYTNHKPFFKTYSLDIDGSFIENKHLHCVYNVEFYDFERFIERIKVELVSAGTIFDPV